MLIGVPAETKDQEHRVGLTPDSARELVARGHDVLVQAGAGAAIGMADADYAAAGARLAAEAHEVFARAELVVKVKELQPAERGWLRPGQRMAVGLGAEVTVLARGPGRLRRLDELHGNRIATRIAGLQAIEEAVTQADLVIGAVLQPGAAAPRLVDRATVARMRRGAVVVDVAIDQGGCFATSRPTSHSQPTFVEEGVVHYCVTNMPGAVARTATLALAQATLPYVLALADQGWRAAVARGAHLRAGLNVVEGAVTCRPVAEALGLPWRDPATL
jgi:alanine dehydrogenase